MFTLSAGGYNTKHPMSFLMSRPNGLSTYLLLLVKVRAAFQIGENKVTVAPGSIILIAPNVPYQYYSLSGCYVDDWLHLSVPETEYFEKMGIPLHTPISLTNPGKFTLYIQQIVQEHHFTEEPFRVTNVDLLLRVLFNNLSLACRNPGCQQYTPYNTRLQDLRLAMQTEPYEKYNPEDIAASLGISSSYFQHLYKKYFGTAFQTDLIHLRLEYAKDLICNTNLTIDRITEMCGYSSEVHFYRQFKKYTGMTPAKYRNHS